MPPRMTPPGASTISHFGNLLSSVTRKEQQNNNSQQKHQQKPRKKNIKKLKSDEKRPKNEMKCLEIWK